MCTKSCPEKLSFLLSFGVCDVELSPGIIWIYEIRMMPFRRDISPSSSSFCMNSKRPNCSGEGHYCGGEYILRWLRREMDICRDS
jgi:hypothetical protein